MDSSALVPESFELDAAPIFEAEQQVIAKAQEEDVALANLKSMSGWEKLASEMKADIEKFKTGGFIKKIEDLPLEEVGKLFVIHQTVATELQKYLDKVENAAKAVVDAQRKAK